MPAMRKKAPKARPIPAWVEGPGTAAIQAAKGLKARSIPAWGAAPGNRPTTNRGLKARAKRPTRRPTHNPFLETTEDE
jgi:hypothetical protein